MTDPLDVGRPHPARVYDFLLGGKNNFPADRAAAAEGLKVNPNAATAPLQNRAFMRRTVRFLAGEAGIRQFLDIGTGLPTSPNVHEVAQAINPTARVLYVDNDPLVLTHARALLTSGPQGHTAYAEADFSDTQRILSAARDNLDLGEPVALLLYAILHFFDNDRDLYPTVARLMDGLPAGSYLVISHVTGDHDPEAWARFLEVMRRQGMHSVQRSLDDVTRFFGELDIVAPGVVPILRWRPDEQTTLTDAQVALHGGVGRKR